MFIPFFENLRGSKIPVSLREFLAFLEALNTNSVTYDIDNFYYLARTIMVKDEKNLDKFDKVFSETFSGLESITTDQIIYKSNLPKDWLKKLAENHLTSE